jgi:predicted phage terminase large subunit-like protein
MIITDKELLQLEKLIELEEAEENFYSYCTYREPDFYKPHRHHLEKLCNILNAFYYGWIAKESKEAEWQVFYDGKVPEGWIICNKIMINMPPQHGKSRTLVNFTQWCLGKNNEERIITASYNDTQAGEFAMYTRDGIQEVKNLPEQHVFSDVFPDTKIKKGNASYQKWALEGQHFNYLGVGVGGGVTGKGATIRIVDDLIKDAEEAINKNILEKKWRWYSGTYSSRNSAEGGAVREIFCATPWSKDDPQGILKATEGHKWFIFQMEVYDKEKDEMLCPDLLSKEEYIDLKERSLRNEITAMIFWANYHNKLVDAAGRLYKELKTYEHLPKDNQGNLLFESIENYTDTADTGEDYLCSICYGVYDGYAYVLDIYYTQDGMEITEKETARMLFENDVRLARIESNNGGRGFARNVERELKEKYNTRKCTVKWFHQSKNKKARIHTNSASVQNMVLFPVDWANRWSDYYEAMTTYKAKGKNTHDDAPDATTGIVENVDKNNIATEQVLDLSAW